jgi:hypothetical protein
LAVCRQGQIKECLLAVRVRVETTRLGKFRSGVDYRRVRVRVRKLGGGGEVKVER